MCYNCLSMKVLIRLLSSSVDLDFPSSKSYGFNKLCFNYQIYREIEDSSIDAVVYSSISGQGPLHGLPVNAPYKPLGILDQKRLLARKSSTTYCYDFPLVWIYFLYCPVLRLMLLCSRITLFTGI